MDRFQLTILGCGSAKPTLRHHPACQIVNHRERLFMIDCGEGSQLQMLKYGVKTSRLTDIFLSHMHGDHVLGVPGLLATLGLRDRDPNSSITIHLPSSGVEVMKTMVDYFAPYLKYSIHYQPLTPGINRIFTSNSLTVESFPLYHRVECYGFIFREAPHPRALIGEMADFHNVPYYMRDAIKNGADFVKPDGTVIANHLLTREGKPSVSYAYCSDTIADHRVASAVKGVDVIYHDTTYLNDLATLAVERGHSTALQAAEIAREAGVGTLILGHYSKRYKDESLLLEEARSVFPSTIAADEGMVIDLRAPSVNLG